MPTFDIITVGSALLDIYMKSDKFIQQGNVLGLEASGKTEVNEVEVCSGGGGSNNAVSFARKGFRTALIAELGTDLTAATIKEELKRENIDIDLLVEEHQEETGISSILVGNDGSRSIAVFRGASGMLTEEDIHWNRLDTKWLYISSLGGEMNLLSELINVALLNGIKIAINPGKKELELAQKWGGVKFYQHCDVLILNKEESELLSESGPIAGPKVIVITDGKKGGTVTTEGKTITYQALKVKTVESTGAGDGFGSGFVAALMKGKDIPTAIQWANKQAASVVSYMGAKKGLLTLKQIES